ncbi:MAG: SRPBCC family protein [Thermoplasmatota archaeon]
MPTKTDTAQSLTLERTFPQSPDQVWSAWTDPRNLNQWFFPADVKSVRVAAFDARKGGAYRIEFGPGPMGAPVATGTFTDVIAGKRLAFTWNWLGQPAMPDSLVTVEFAKAGSGTKLTLRHDGLPTAEVAAHHELGWNGILDRCAKALGAPRKA